MPAAPKPTDLAQRPSGNGLEEPGSLPGELSEALQPLTTQPQTSQPQTSQPRGDRARVGAPGPIARPGRRGDRWRSKLGAGGLEPVDLELAAKFEATYADWPGAPVAVVIAAYNEGENVSHVVAEIPKQVCGLAAEVIVVVDGASDATAEEAAAGGALVCDVPVNRGQGAALRLGYHLARERGAEYIITSDADGQWRSAEMDRVLRPVVAGEADFVSGSRRMGSTASHDAARNTGVVVFAALISVLIRHRITDPACGLRAMRAGVTASVVLEQPQYQASELEIGVAMAGYRIAEVPIAMKARRSGKTKKGGNLVYGARFTSVVLRTWAREVARRSTKTQRS